jgi:hypothetical protein
MLARYPDGIGGPAFYQKDVPDYSLTGSGGSRSRRRGARWSSGAGLVRGLFEEVPAQPSSLSTTSTATSPLAAARAIAARTASS